MWRTYLWGIAAGLALSSAVLLGGPGKGTESKSSRPGTEDTAGAQPLPSSASSERADVDRVTASAKAQSESRHLAGTEAQAKETKLRRPENHDPAVIMPRAGQLLRPFLGRFEHHVAVPTFEELTTKPDFPFDLINARKLKAHRKRLEELSLLGTAPWEYRRFQVIGFSRSSPRKFPHVVFGSDFVIPASPEDSLRWYEQRYGELSEDAAQAALSLLEHYERRRKQARSLIWHALLSSVSSNEDSTEIIAYAVVQRRLFLIRKKRSSLPMRQIADEAFSIFQDLATQVDEILR